MKKTLFLFVFGLLPSIFLFSSGSDELNPLPEPVWPSEDWESIAPADAGLDSVILAELFEQMTTREWAIDGICLVRKGRLAIEAYRQPFDRTQLHIIHSCTKSIVSALTGIAMEEGLIQGPEQRLRDIFPEYAAAMDAAAVDSLCLEHLLTMRTGLKSEDSYLYNWKGLQAMGDSLDWTRFALTFPSASAPGTRFDYSNTASFLLSAVLSRTTGRSAAEYMQEKLFTPLGINTYEWPRNPDGINYGWGGMRLHLRDMAKFGYLYLQNGVWNGEQLVPSDWVRKSTQGLVRAGTLENRYGYQWWVHSDTLFMALGYQGQYILVDREHDLVTVFVSSLPDNDFFVPNRLYHEYITRAVHDGRVRTKTGDSRRLQEAIEAWEHSGSAKGDD